VVRREVAGYRYFESGALIGRRVLLSHLFEHTATHGATPLSGKESGAWERFG
jgi:hypothetical protein